MPSKNDLAPETPPSKGISSRLLTMKFMQRAVASESAQSSPQSASSSTKRRKVDSPLTGEFHSFDEAAIQAAMKAQEATRQAALSRHKTESADTPWVLSGFETNPKLSAAARPAQNFTVVGFTSIDAPDGQEDQPQRVKAGRQRVGNFKSKADQKSTNIVSAKKEDVGDAEEGSSSSEDESEDEHADGDRRKHASRRVSAESVKAREFRDKRKKSQVNLNTLSSISGGSPSGAGGSGRSANFTCHGCGKPGHRIAACPEKPRRGRGGGHGGSGPAEKRKSSAS